MARHAPHGCRTGAIRGKCSESTARYPQRPGCDANRCMSTYPFPSYMADTPQSWLYRVSSPTRPTYSPWPSEYPAPFSQPLPPIVASKTTNTDFGLHVQGIYLDMIVSLVGDPPPIEEPPNLSTITRWLDELCDSPHLNFPIVDSRPVYPHRPKRDLYPDVQNPLALGEPMLLAALRTLTFDIDFDPHTVHHTRPAKGLEQLASLPVEDAARGFIEGSDAVADLDYKEKSRLQMRRDLLQGRRPALTQRGYICMVPAHAEVEDCILALAGGCMLYVVRHTRFAPERYTFIGETYMHGWMDDGLAGSAGPTVTFCLATKGHIPTRVQPGVILEYSRRTSNDCDNLLFLEFTKRI
ncbi:hypothetical protein B0T14DRAFT_251674 [Immersiella caudata]|uniref:Uncharacterized protein n=1 Tax=Immersiella caudata TaxID=314043 RepID=A0AA39WJU9_9PEZI|nr:hypothetical protein B0T14DRAFT_251674 [Immersiella caudata]